MTDATYTIETTGTRRTVTLLSEVWHARLGTWQLAWHRPTAVRVERGGQEQEFPIVDVTRILQLAALGFIGLNAVLALWRRQSEE